MPAGKAAGKGHSRRFVLTCFAGASAALAAFPFAPQAEASPSGRPLIVFFSRTGRTRRLAAMIRERVGGDMAELKTVKPYPQDYDAAVSQAKKEQQAGARPALAAELPPLEGCGTVFLGYPNWWRTMPMALFTLLEKHRFSGKTIVPFCTHGGSAWAAAWRTSSGSAPRPACSGALPPSAAGWRKPETSSMPGCTA
jgi:flavodoxin